MILCLIVLLGICISHVCLMDCHLDKLWGQ